MPKFIVRIGRDATVYFKATVEAPDLETVKAMRHQNYFATPLDVEWEEDGFSAFDNIENVEVFAPTDVDCQSPIFSED